MSQRIDRVDELLRQEIGRILAKDVGTRTSVSPP